MNVETMGVFFLYLECDNLHVINLWLKCNLKYNIKAKVESGTLYGDLFDSLDDVETRVSFDDVGQLADFETERGLFERLLH